MLQLQSAGYSYGENTVLQDISFTIQQGEIVGILGPSGSGKTTLLKILSHLAELETGSYRINDTWISKNGVLSAPNVVSQAMSEVGVVFQQFNLFPHMTVLENVVLPLKLRKKLSKETCRTEAIEMLKSMDLQDKLESYPHQLSGGQQQRVAIARALILKPQILLIDEPTSSLDAAMTQTVIEILRTLNTKGLTLILITHDLIFAKALCQRVIEIGNGRLTKDCVADEYFPTL